MNSFTLFSTRLIQNCRYQYNVIKKVLDWTVLVYLVLPAVVIFSFIYRGWWHTPPLWMESISFSFVSLFFYCFCWIGRIHTFVLEADKVFLIKKYSLFNRMKKWGYLYSIFKHISGIAVLTSLALPYLFLVCHWSVGQIVQLFFALYSLKLWIILFKFFLLEWNNKFLKSGCRVVLFCIGIFIWFLLLSDKPFIPLLLLMMFIFHPMVYFYKIKTRSSFDQMMIEEKKAKLSSTSLILQLSMQVEKPSYSMREKPLFNRKSRRIFHKRTGVTGFLELFIKVFIRNSSYWSSYIRIIAVTTTAIIFLPTMWLKFILFIILAVFLSIWSHAVWVKIMNTTHIFDLYKKDVSYNQAKKWAINLLTGLAIGIVCFNFYLHLFFFPFSR
ncbi:MAG: ABC transporter permease [Bacillus sp. (in: firmicutes)]